MRSTRLWGATASYFYDFYAGYLFNYYPRTGDPVTTVGYTMADGVAYSADDDRGFFPLCISADAWHFGATGTCPAKTKQAVAGHPIDLGIKQDDSRLLPRTAVAWSADQQTMWLILADGRQPRYSHGASLEQLAQFARQRGAAFLINLDGGGSTTLISEEDGRWQPLNSPIHARIPGWQRPVANHLGIFPP